VFNYTKTFKILSTFLIAGVLLSLTSANSYGTMGTFSDYKYAYGPIASINNDWVLAGHWMGYYNPSNLTDSGFHSTFDMAMKNGSAPHMHQISNATANDVSMEGNNEIVQGTATVSMKDGPVSNVSTTWTLYDNNTLAIEMDPSMIDNHFGETPVYGLVLTPEKEMKTMNSMMEDTKFMDKWIPLMMQNVMKNLQLDGGNSTSMPMMNMSNNEAPLLPNGTGFAIQ
jgi:hypothetical protein